MLPLAFGNFLFALLVGFALICHAQDQTGFISIDCGLEPNVTSYTEEVTSLNFVSDRTFVDTGERKIILEEYKNLYQRQYSTLRSFPEGNRSCYKIDVVAGTKYLIRAGFFYGDYDKQEMPPMFDLYIGNDLWNSVNITDSTDTVDLEIIHVSPRNLMHVCLVNKGHGIPFISTLELRPLDNATYQVPTAGSLALAGRWAVGSAEGYRYDEDFHDRFWYSWQPATWKYLSEPKNWKYFNTKSLAVIDSKDSDDHLNIPSEVMRSAAAPEDESGALIFWWPPDGYTSDEHYFYMHFAEIQVLQANQTREFDIFHNGDRFYGPVSPVHLQRTTVRNKIPLKASQHNFTISKTESSSLPPILNALEIYTVKTFSLRETDQQDVDAIAKIKSTYGLKRNWQGDPCLPKEYLWEGLNCSDNGNDEPPRIISLNLSSSELTGEIPHSIANLTMIQILELSNNNLKGPVPEFLSQLQNLRILNLENNQLNGPLPAELMEKWKKGLVKLSVKGNPNICASVSCKKKHSIVAVVASVVGTFVLLSAAAIWWGFLRNTHGSTLGQYPLESRKRQFKYDYTDILRITNNFERAIGKGGFGTVYHGFIDDTQVAVKMISRPSVQGYQQFQAEVNILQTVHHKNLTALVGYFTDEYNMGLIYEYMVNGDLQSHLSAVNNSINVLKWEDRVQIAIDAGQGLEYLHHGCKPPIIHRDVKSANILLDEKFQAKLSDFGLSKTFPMDNRVTHVSTVVAGTPGYVDPTYWKSNRLNEKSDVYSFGIVLLEIITGRSATSKSSDNTCLSEWVTSMLEKGLIRGIIDPRLQENFPVNSAWKAVEIAINCLSLNSAERPTMSQVVVELKECLEATKAAYESGTKSKDSLEEIPLNLLSHDIYTQPSAR